MKKLLIFVGIIITSSILGGNVYAQENVFSIGYGKTFVSKDSSNVNITFAINNVPGSTSSPGSYYFVNEPLKGNWGWYLKPVADINLCSAVASAPNNVSFSVPIGLSYDFNKIGDYIFTGYLEAAPAMVSDRDFKNKLYYGSLGAYIKGATTGKIVEFTFLTGIALAEGSRIKSSNPDHSYSRLGLPAYLTFSCWPASYKHGKDKPTDFRRIALKYTFKYNRIFDDAPAQMSRNDYFLNSPEADFYITPNFGLKFTYSNGFDEPVFVNNNAYTIGIVLAKK
jgi:hypothetical protein